MKRSVSYKQDKRGATLMEFAIVGPVFMFMLFSIVEYGLYFFKRSLVHNLLYESARVIQTGQIQKSDNPLTEFQAAYCAKTMSMLDCIDVSFDVRAFDSLDAIAFPEAQFDANGRPTNFVFEPGKGEQITAIRVAVPHHFISPMMQNVFQPEGVPAIIVGYSIAKNEPF